MLTLNEYDTMARQRHHHKLSGIACPECGNNMTRNDNIVYTSFPPLIKVTCTMCDFEKLVIQ